MERSIRLTHITSAVGAVAHQVTALHFSSYCPLHGWRPAINAFRYPDHLELCVDLAGVGEAEIELRVEPRQLMVRGSRRMPEPPHPSTSCQQVLALEIESGPFERRMEFAEDVDPKGVRAEQRNGLLWIHLPLRAKS